MIHRPGNLLAVSLGVNIVNFGNTNSSFEQAVTAAPLGVMLFGIFSPSTTYLVIGFNLGDYGSFLGLTYNNTQDVKKLCQIYGGTWTWY